MAIVRVRDGVRCSTFDHHAQVFVALSPGLEFDSADPVVRDNAWAFTTDAEIAGTDRKARRVVSAPIMSDVEDASATPGAKRNR